MQQRSQMLLEKATSTCNSQSVDEDGVDMNKHEDEAMRRKMELEAEERKLEETLEYQRRIEDEAKQKHFAVEQDKSNSRVQVFDVFKNQTNGHVEDTSRKIKAKDDDEKRFQADMSKVVRQSIDVFHSHYEGGDPFVTCALHNIFKALNTTSLDSKSQVVSPTALRMALNNFYPQSSFISGELHVGKNGDWSQSTNSKSNCIGMWNFGVNC
ncbi:unnamed protein product [Lactuca saligna]|uniref:Uncharacterized protein n=1 Tax=Lactuca saligna TaxID=75948 RepID=A0AA36E3U3_LACSI|nr:unnamed protein product [Lactuca saligna]